MAAPFRLLGCFHGNSIFHRSRGRVCSESPSPPQAFQADLAESLQNLLHLYKQAMHGETDHVSLSWICSAVDMVISTQASVKQAIAHAHQEGVMVNVQQYLEDSVKLLDVCCLLKKALDGVHTYVKAAKNAVRRSKQVLSEGDLLRAKHALLSAQACLQELVRADVEMRVTSVRASEKTTRLAACGSLLRRMGENLSNEASQQPKTSTSALADSISSTATALPGALYAAERVTLFVFKVLAAALAASSEPRGRSVSTFDAAPLRSSRQPRSWEHPLLCLQAQHSTELARMHTRKRSPKRDKSTITLQLPEVHCVEASLKQMSNLVVQILEKRRPRAASVQESSFMAAVVRDEPSYRVLETSKQVNALETCSLAVMRDDLSNLVLETSKQVNALESCTARLQLQLESLLRSLLDTRMALLGSLCRSGTHV